MPRQHSCRFAASATVGVRERAVWRPEPAAFRGARHPAGAGEPPVAARVIDLHPGRCIARYGGRCAAAQFSGHDGAVIADILVQSVGLAAYLVRPSRSAGLPPLVGAPDPPAGARHSLHASGARSRCRFVLDPAPRAELAGRRRRGGRLGALGLATRAGLASLALPLAMAAAALVALLLVSIIGLTPGDWRELGSGAGRRATRVARASGRGGAATAAFGQLLIRRWREARLARREALRPPPPWTAPVARPL